MKINQKFSRILTLFLVATTFAAGPLSSSARADDQGAGHGTESSAAKESTPATGEAGKAAEKADKTKKSRKEKATDEKGSRLDKGKTAILKTTAGDITVKLFADRAPKTVDNFVGLATGKKDWTDPKSGKAMKNKALYNGTIFHRVIPNFMVQGGDPLGDGTGGPGYTFEDETSSSDNFDKPGILAMANAGPGTNGSQFFITVAATPWLNGKHTIFGEVTGGMDIVNKIVNAPKGANDRPDKPVKITRITVK